MNRGKGNLSQEWRTIILMKEMHWTYDQYMEQPQWVIELLEIQNNIEAKWQNKK